MKQNKFLVSIAFAFLVFLIAFLYATGALNKSKGATGATEFGGAYLEYDWPTRYGG